LPTTARILRFQSAYSSWVVFASTGNPGWATYDPQRRVVEILGG
jgi:hypothetical protein